MEKSQDKILGILYGLAIGDGLGFPVEFIKLKAIKERYGPQGVTGPPSDFLISDDTQMTMALARALIQAGEGDLDRVMNAVAQEFILWKNSPDNNRAPGKTCLAGVQNLENGVGWRKSGIQNSKGCGSAMRVATVGYLYSDHPDKLREIAHGSGIMTHGHPDASAACIGGAYLVKLGLDQEDPSCYIEKTYTFVEGISSLFEKKLLLVEKLLQKGIKEESALSEIGEGWMGQEAIPLGLYCFLRYPDDYRKAVLRGANTDGDSDSIGCMAGFISGARLGIQAIPEDWVAKIEKSKDLADLAKKLFEKKNKFSS